MQKRHGHVAFFFWLLLVWINPVCAKPTLNAVEVQPLPGDQIKLTLAFNQPIKLHRAFLTQNPKTLVIDFTPVDLVVKPTERNIRLGALAKYQLIATEEKTRLVVFLAHGAKYRINTNANFLDIILSGQDFPEYRKQYQVTKPLNRNFVKSTVHYIRGINFKVGDNKSGLVIIKVSDPGININVDDKNGRIVAEFADTGIASAYLQSLDVSDFGTPVKTIAAARRSEDVRIVLQAKTPYDVMSYQVNDRFIIDVQGTTQTNEKKDIQARRFTGRHLSLNFQNISVRAALQLLAQFAQINIVVSDSVRGDMTLRLNNVPWDQAMAIILETRGLGQQKIGDTLLIAPADEIAARERQTLLAKQQVDSLETLQSELVQINYGKADEIANLLRGTGGTPILSSRGSVSVDARTNTLWIQDTPTKLTDVRVLVKKLDRPVSQVLIEARVVTIEKSALREIGVEFGITNPNHLSGTLLGANELQRGIAPADIPVERRLNVNLPSTVAIAGANPGTLGIALAKLSSDVLLDLELSALQTENRLKIIASPRLVTANQKEANIETGEEIPYQQATSSGATAVSFKKAVLSLRVTPQITPDNRIILTLAVNQDSRGREVLLGVPSINTRQITTQVLVNNGQTIVLGGVYQKNSRNQLERIPFLSDIPLLGYLFQRKLEREDLNELLIFVTPKIVKQPLYQP